MEEKYRGPSDNDPEEDTEKNIRKKEAQEKDCLEMC